MNDRSPSHRPPWLLLLARLGRWRLSLAVAGAALAGMLLYSPRPGWAAALRLLGSVWLLAAAASAGNQRQERDLDSRMLRTRNRPLPQGHLSPITALVFAVGGGLAGLALLPGGWPPALIGLAALGCYNGLYTPLKRRTPLALLPGALCGALPPLIGWSAAGGVAGDFRIVLVAALLYLWQLPHFWRLADRHAADYRRAGLPLLQDRLDPTLAHLARCAWTLAMTAAALLLPLFGLLQGVWNRRLLLAVALLLAISGLLRPRPQRRQAPAWADLCLLLLLLLLVGERLLAAGAPGPAAGLFPALPATLSG